jgi:tricorn protease
VVNEDSQGEYLQVLATAAYPSDGVEAIRVPMESKDTLEYVGTSTDSNYILLIMAGKLKITPRTSAGIEAFMKDTQLTQNIAHLEGLHVDVWPALEYQQMYKDAWRMLRDYFYDPELTGLLWDVIFERYLPLVDRCSKREELDDGKQLRTIQYDQHMILISVIVLRQMASELSALRVFVYGGDYSLPYGGESTLDDVNAIASLGAVLRRSVEKNGYVVISIPERDEDFPWIDEVPMYSPLSSSTLELSGQVSLLPGDVIVGVNGEHVMNVPDIHTLMQNKAGESVRLEIVRYNSTSQHQEIRRLKQNTLQADDEILVHNDERVSTEPLIVVPISHEKSFELFYAAWEYKTRQLASRLSADEGFTTGYIHIQDMSGASAEDAFVRGFYPDYDKQGEFRAVRF